MRTLKFRRVKTPKPPILQMISSFKRPVSITDPMTPHAGDILEKMEGWARVPASQSKERAFTPQVLPVD